MAKKKKKKKKEPPTVTIESDHVQLIWRNNDKGGITLDVRARRPSGCRTFMGDVRAVIGSRRYRGIAFLAEED